MVLKSELSDLVAAIAAVCEGKIAASVNPRDLIVSRQGNENSAARLPNTESADNDTTKNCASLTPSVTSREPCAPYNSFRTPTLAWDLFLPPLEDELPLDEEVSSASKGLQATNGRSFGERPLARTSVSSERQRSPFIGPDPAEEIARHHCEDWPLQNDSSVSPYMARSISREAETDLCEEPESAFETCWQARKSTRWHHHNRLQEEDAHDMASSQMHTLDLMGEGGVESPTRHGLDLSLGFGSEPAQQEPAYDSNVNKRSTMILRESRRGDKTCPSKRLSHRIQLYNKGRPGRNESINNASIEQSGMEQDAIHASEYQRSRLSSPLLTGLDLIEKSLRHLWITYIPDQGIQPAEVSKIVCSKLPSTDDSIKLLLVRLFYAIGSPDALLQLRDALAIARREKLVVLPKESTGILHTVQALDSLDSLSHHSHMLRRYYLVRLLDYRLAREAHCRGTRYAAKRQSRKLKYDVRRIEDLCAGLERSRSENLPSDIQRSRMRADSQALSDLMATLYPHLKVVKKRLNDKNSSEYQRQLGKLKTRLTCARNWLGLAKEFSIGILALIPSGGVFHVSVDQ